MKLFWQCMFSPRLYKVYRDGPKDSMYNPGIMEKYGDKFLSTVSTIFAVAYSLMNVGFYSSPFIWMYVHKRGYFSVDEMKSLGRLFVSVTCVAAISLFARAFGRARNEKYVRFIRALKLPMHDKHMYLEEIRKYDFDVKAWPTTYTVNDRASFSNDPILKMDPIYVGTSWWNHHPFRFCANPDRPRYQQVIIQILAYIATHTFGLRLVYPGSISVVNSMLWKALFMGRTSLVENYDGKRTKIGTADGNTLDTIFVDNRYRYGKGKVLVICCEGNSGFYEIGIIATPIKTGYSALSWNHPGFGGSTGNPYPSQEQNAIDAVMQFAINELGYRPENIVMFGWSIGGYTAAWAAVNYPVHSLVLDATFDDLLPLAQNQMPKSWSLLVKEVIRSYVNLNIVDLVADYKGPIQLVRRTEDEIISLRQGILSTNRGNFLLMELIKQRHKTSLADPFSKVALLKLLAMTDVQRNALNVTELSDFDRPLLPLISKYLHDYKSSHCTPLPETNFAIVMDRIEADRRE